LKALKSEFCLEALNEAIHTFGLPEIINTDQGSQFRSFDWADRLKRTKIKISMGGKARYLDEHLRRTSLARFLKYECVCLDAWETGASDLGYLNDNPLRPRAAQGRQPPDTVSFNATPNPSAGAGSRVNYTEICARVGGRSVESACLTGAGQTQKADNRQRRYGGRFWAARVDFSYWGVINISFCRVH